MSDKWEKDLDKRLRAGRPAPSSGLISAIVARIPKRVEDRRPRASFRLALAGALTVALASAVAAVGGVGYASKQVSHAVGAVKSTAIPQAKSASAQYKGDPEILGFEPKAACVGQRVIVMGENFLGTTLVTVGGIKAKKFKVMNDTRLSLWVPNGFTGGKIMVTTPKGTGTSEHGLKLKFTDCTRT